MQPIYISSPLRSAATQSPDYSSRKIDGQTVGDYDDMHVIGTPTMIQPFYGQYVANLPAFLTATALQTRVTCGRTYKPGLDASLLLPLGMPPLCLSPPAPFKNEEEKVRYTSGLGSYQWNETVYQKMSTFIVRDVPLSARSSLPKSNPNAPAPIDACSVLSWMEYATTLKIVTLFLTTHSYAAFQAEAETGQRYYTSADITFPRLVLGSTKMRAVHTDYPLEQQKSIQSFEMSGPSDIESYPPKNTYGTETALLVAKPAPLYPWINYGPVSNIPNLPGFSFPYFPGMTRATEGHIISTFRQFFINCFGLTESSRKEAFVQWQKHVPRWMKTEQGRALGHIIFLIRTALEAQGRLFVVISNGKYIGSVVIGYKFDIICNGMPLVATDNKTLRSHLAKMDEHVSALDEIAQILQRIDISGDEMVEELVLTNKTPRQVLGEIHSRDLALCDEVDELSRLVNKLTFRQDFWSPSHGCIIEALKMLNIADTPIPDDMPCHFDSSTYQNKTRYNLILSVFGPTAPTFVDAQGDWIKLPEGLAAEDPQSSRAAETDIDIRLPSIFVTMKKLKIAINDTTGMYQNRRIKQRGKHMSQGFRTIEYGGAQRHEIWNALKCIPWKVDERAISSKKRKAIEASAADKEAKKAKKDEEKGPKEVDLGELDF